MSEKLAVLVPPEPPEGSVFLDRLHRAWQRIGPVWLMAGTVVRPLIGPGSSSSLRWGQLLLDCGEGEVLWEPTPQMSAEQAAEQSVVHAAPSEMLDEAFAAAHANAATVNPPVLARGRGEELADVLRRGLLDAQAQLRGIRSAARAGEALGRVAYERYSAQVEARSVSGDPLPAWGELRLRNPNVANAWVWAAARVADVVLRGAHDGPSAAADAFVLCAQCRQQPPQLPGDDDPIGGRFCASCIERCHEGSDVHRCAVCRTPEVPK